jgi:hypothetical protein
VTSAVPVAGDAFNMWSRGYARDRRASMVNLN